ncbi:MarR family winged helix-turn-helix transcriptional regulator [Actinoplanes xinjiangensis]|uniref:MarR family winged helix-turn-helix transcriptional regulator n=1 Tax=Actinoplanes xinjiangensis TaxID=512350 RepID=UPI0034285B6F
MDELVTQRPLGRLVAMLAREFTARTVTVLQRHGFTEAGWWLLSELATAPPGGLPLGEAARRAGLGASTATALSDRLAEQGLLLRQRCPGNRRLVIAELTDAGYRGVATVRAELNGLFADTYERLSSTERDSLTRLLTRLLDADAGTSSSEHVPLKPVLRNTTGRGTSPSGR